MAAGSCVCKGVTYEYTGEPTTKAVCHCYECQKLTGTGFTYNFIVPRENFKFTAGTPKYNSFTQESGVEVGYRFCPDCGTTLIKESEAEMFKSVYMVQAGTIDSHDLIKEKPTVELWTCHRAEWIQPTPEVEQKAEFV
ncbi:hypothetical protein NKR23_g12239 [Pleurostoma richardsiae]|uniref:CENP-V/GFA domain-containing protein n=1 Tax=Pleurostoma richardsiae TaxID=41990 RepID=A0AA38R1Q0_9PEZI|nr:hypothetical protein NKR23_g12239 [Pleurostoma richardsiae]